MEIDFGRKRLAFAEGTAHLVSYSVTERAKTGEDEQAFTDRLLRKFGEGQGTIEIVFKHNRPDYAIIVFEG